MLHEARKRFYPAEFYFLDLTLVAESTPAEALARELLEYAMGRMAYFKAPAWFVFFGELPMGTSAKLVKRAIFPQNDDPREHPGAIDLRALKRPPSG